MFDDRTLAEARARGWLLWLAQRNTEDVAAFFAALQGGLANDNQPHDDMEGTRRDLAAAFDAFFGDSDEAPGEVELHR
jgi:hypothetical protein